MSGELTCDGLMTGTKLMLLINPGSQPVTDCNGASGLKINKLRTENSVWYINSMKMFVKSADVIG